MSDAGAADRATLRDLAERYAAGVDRRDVDLFLSAFHEDGCLLVFQPSESPEPRGTRRGRAELADVITRISRHDRTFHLIGNSRYEVDGDGDHAMGEVYCEAHHLDRLHGSADGGTDHIMYIRYQDTYTRDGDRSWRIAERRVLVDWTETRTITS